MLGLDMVSLRGSPGSSLYVCSPHGEMDVSSKVVVLVETDVNVGPGVFA